MRMHARTQGRAQQAIALLRANTDLAALFEAEGLMDRIVALIAACPSFPSAANAAAAAAGGGAASAELFVARFERWQQDVKQCSSFVARVMGGGGRGKPLRRRGGEDEEADEEQRMQRLLAILLGHKQTLAECAGSWFVREANIGGQ